MVGFCLRAHPLQNTERKTLPTCAGPVQGCTWNSFSHLKIPSFGKCRWLQHNHSGALACSQFQSGFGLLPGACAWLAWPHCRCRGFPWQRPGAIATRCSQSCGGSIVRSMVAWSHGFQDLPVLQAVGPLMSLTSIPESDTCFSPQFKSPSPDFHAL